MPQGIYTIGRDVTLTIIGPNGPIVLDTITNWKRKQKDSIQQIVPINGSVDHLQFFYGWEGSFDLERAGPQLDQYFALLESNYFSGIQTKNVFIKELIDEPDGSLSGFKYPRVKLSYTDAGDFAGDKSVKQSVNFVSGPREVSL
jgi:hypothetical protein